MNFQTILKKIHELENLRIGGNDMEYLSRNERNEIIKKIPKNVSRNYFKTLIIDYINNIEDYGEYIYKIKEEDIENIIDNLIENDLIWDTIDTEISQELFKFKKTQTSLLKRKLKHGISFTDNWKKIIMEE